MVAVFHRIALGPTKRGGGHPAALDVGGQPVVGESVEILHAGLYAGLHDVPPYSHDFSTLVPRPYLNDERIKEKIERRLFWSPFVHTNDIKVAVAGGVATMTGSVETWIGWSEAEKAARRSGATSVVNRVTVQRGARR
jgi:hypothetical protein